MNPTKGNEPVEKFPQTCSSITTIWQKRFCVELHSYRMPPQLFLHAQLQPACCSIAFIMVKAEAEENKERKTGCHYCNLTFRLTLPHAPFLRSRFSEKSSGKQPSFFLRGGGRANPYGRDAWLPIFSRLTQPQRYSNHFGSGSVAKFRKALFPRHTRRRSAGLPAHVAFTCNRILRCCAAIVISHS